MQLFFRVSFLILLVCSAPKAVTGPSVPSRQAFDPWKAEEGYVQLYQKPMENAFQTSQGNIQVQGPMLSQNYLTPSEYFYRARTAPMDTAFIYDPQQNWALHECSAACPDPLQEIPRLCLLPDCQEDPSLSRKNLLTGALNIWQKFSDTQQNIAENSRFQVKPAPQGQPLPQPSAPAL
jgi:hypothetical protein